MNRNSRFAGARLSLSAKESAKSLRDMGYGVHVSVNEAQRLYASTFYRGDFDLATYITYWHVSGEAESWECEGEES